MFNGGQVTKLFSVETEYGSSDVFTYNEMVNANQDDAGVIAFVAVAECGEVAEFGGGASVFTVIQRIV